MASEVPLIPCINRQFSQILDISESDLIAYGSRCSICILRFSASPIPIILDSKFIPNAHPGKITSLSFCKVNDNYIVSFGEDNFLKVWDLETQLCISHLETKDNIRTVEWLHGNASNVVFPSSCYVKKWNYTTSNTKNIKTGSESYVSVLSSSKMSPELLAVGHNVGTISIMNIDSETVMHKLKSHLSEVTSLSWSTVLSRTLLSTSLDQTARVWKIGEVKPVKTFTYPKSRKTDDKKYPLRICGMFHPENSDVIICSNVGGYIGEVTFEDEKPKFNSYVEKNFDNAFLHRSINIMKPYLNENNKTLFLTSDHIKISLWDVSEKKLLTSAYYLMGNVYDLAASIINPYNLAIGTSDGCLRVWNTSENTKIDMTAVHISFRLKIMTVAWHPIEGNLIAYGTDEGRVGIADIQKKKSLYSFESHHTNSVYVLQWAPCSKIKDSDGTFFLYSCSSSTIFIHELHKPKEKPLDFDEIITCPPDLELVQKTHSELSWNSDYTCLIVGSYKGFLDLFDNKFNFLTRVTMQMKNVESVKWHPKYTFTSSKGSEYSSWFAAAGSDCSIKIFDTSDIQNENSEFVCRPTKTLIGHKKRVSSLCWSPHNDGYLASACRDGTVLVWNVITSTILANYPYHQEVVYAVYWSYFDPDIIYSGGMDCSLRVWKISEQIQSAPEKSQVIKRKTKPLKVQMQNNNKGLKRGRYLEKNTVFMEPCDDDKNSIDENSKESDSLKTEEVSTVEGFNNKKTKRQSENGEPFQKFKSKKLFSVCAEKPKEKKVENILKLTDLLSQSLDSSDPENMTLISDMVTDEELLDCGLYCDQLTAVKMLETKANIEEKAGNNDHVIKLQLLANNVESLLVNAAENKKLSDFLMAAAVTVSRKFYNEMCKKFAVQLIEERQYVKAGFYLMFCGELHNAVKIMLDKQKIMEALALAKAQLSADDPFIHGILTKAANYFSTQNDFEKEAECYLAMNEPSQAAKVLYRCADSSCMYACAYICKKFNLIEEAETYGYICMEKCLAESTWPTFYKVINIIDSLKVYKLLVRVHELVFNQIKILKKYDIPSSKLFGITGSKLLIWESKAFGDSNVSFLPFICDVLKSENILPENKDSLVEIHTALDSLISKRQRYETSAEVHINLAIYTSKVIISSLLNDSSIVEEYLLKVFPVTYSIAFLPRVVFWLFLPFDIYWCSNEDAFTCENNYLESQSSFLHLQNIYKSLCDKFVSLNASSTEFFSVSQIFSSSLDETVKQVLNILLTKTSKDSMVLYFSMCYIAEMRKLAKHGWKFRCYNSLQDEKTEKVESEECDLPVQCNEKNSEKDAVCIDHKNDKELGAELNGNCTENENQNNHPLVILTMKDNIETYVSSENKDTNFTSPLIENNSLSPNFLKSDDFVEKEENITTSTIVSKFKSLVDPVCNDVEKVVANGFSEDINNGIENKIFLTKKFEDEILSPKANGKIEDNSCLPINDGENGESILLHNNNHEVKENVLLEKTCIEENVFLEKNYVEADKNMFSQNDNNEVEEKNTLIESSAIATIEKENISLLDHTYNALHVEGMYSETEDDHLQCWSDVSFFYTLTKSFASINCKDEYALLFYLQKYLHYLDNVIADITRQKSVKLLLNDHNQASDVTEQDSQLNQKNACNDLINVNEDHVDNDVVSSSLINEETSYSVKENGSNCSNDNGCFMVEREAKDEIGESPVKNDFNQNHKLSDENNVNFSGPVSKDYTNSVLHENIQQTEEHMVLENLELDHEKISEITGLLKSVAFDYPNPFDAVSLINGLCFDIFRKNPCNFVRKKFHDFAHEVNKWNAKFCVKDENVKCDICKEIITSN